MGFALRMGGFELRFRRKQWPQLAPVNDSHGWWPLVVREPFTGAWQRNIEWSAETVLAFHAVWACITLIAGDISKLRPKLVARDGNGIWSETDSAAFSPVLRKPNRFQNRIQFIASWMMSKLIRGNTYVLLERDDRRVVRAMYILDPQRVTPLVAPDGSIFYKLNQDNLSGIDDADTTVPASEIIHDRWNCLFHPLVGISPIYAAGAPANVGLKAQENATRFFDNDNTPSGILTAPGVIDQKKADELKQRWRSRQRGEVAVLGNDLKYTPLRMSSEDAQMIEHLQWTAKTVASTFHVPPFKIGVGDQPTYQNGEILNQIYYSDCLQALIEQYELCMDEGLGIGEGVRLEGGKVFGVELDLETLLRMDTATQVKTLGEGVSRGIIAPDEARRKLDLQPVAGGATPYLQQQNYSLAALAKRDAKEDPFGKEATAPEPAPAEQPKLQAVKLLTPVEAVAAFRKALAA